MAGRKRMRKSKDRLICGVLGGVAEYYSLDPKFVRLLFVVVVLFTGFLPGLIIYLISYAIMPER